MQENIAYTPTDMQLLMRPARMLSSISVRVLGLRGPFNVVFIFASLSLYRYMVCSGSLVWRHAFFKEDHRGDWYKEREGSYSCSDFSCSDDEVHMPEASPRREDRFLWRHIYTASLY